ncbi:PLP-dependent aminotransferase family protein [Taklimakanibacter deserti]|uniref:aminotransferase-like domain-containing protein n=1 Tax=Taklimakanibacter deserti TaxID=2267839 RepID=UPI000E64ADEE
MDHHPSAAAPPTRVEQVIQAIRDRIAARILKPGARLPSIRGFAAAQGVSKSTVVEAYDRLVADGTIGSRRGSGFFVAGPLPPLTLAEIGPKLDRAIDPLWVSRQSLEAGDRMLKPGCGWLPSSWMPQEALRRAMRALARRRHTPYLTDYGEPRGLAPLRQFLSRRLAEQGIEAPPDQILLTDSGTQAIDLICRLLIEPGDTVLVDDPCYFNFIAMLRAHRARIVSVPYTPSGPEMESFAKVLAEHRPRLYITNCALHNPTGATLSPAQAHRLLKLAEAHGLTIIEDGIFMDFEREPGQRLAAFDGLERVIHIGSFSKTLSAALRSGFIAARPEWIDGLIDMKLATSFGSDPFAAELVFAVLSDGFYRKHVEGLNRRLAQAMGETLERLKALGLEPWLEPKGGMFLWMKLPGGLDSADVARRALAENIVLAPGNVFSPTRSAGNYMRFNVAQSRSQRLFTVLEKALVSSR